MSLQSRLQQLFAGDEGEFDRRFGGVLDDQQRALQMLGQLRLAREVEALPPAAGSGVRGVDMDRLGQAQGVRAGGAGQLVSNVDTAVDRTRDRELARFIEARNAERARVGQQIRNVAQGLTSLGVSQGMNLVNTGVQAQKDRRQAALDGARRQREDETIAMLRKILGGA
jgi:hypothetical protein